MKSVWRLGCGITSINRFGNRFASLPRYISSRSSKTEKLAVDKAPNETHAVRKSVKTKSSINENLTGAKESKAESKPRSSDAVGKSSAGESLGFNKAEKGEVAKGGDNAEGKKPVKTRVKKQASDGGEVKLSQKDVSAEKKPVKRPSKAEASDEKTATAAKTKAKASRSKEKVAAQEQAQEAGGSEKTSEENQSLEISGAKLEEQVQKPDKLETALTLVDQTEPEVLTSVDEPKPKEEVELKVASLTGEKPQDDDDGDGVDEELKEFLQRRKLKNEETKLVEDDEDVEVGYVWDFRNVKLLPDSIKVLEKKLRELVATAPAHDRRTAVVKLKLALQLTNESPERSVNLATAALKVFGIEDSLEQGTCLSALGAGYRRLGENERSLSLLRRALSYFEEKDERGEEVLSEKQFVLNELGMVLLSLDRRKEGVESLMESLELLEAILSYGDPELGSEYRETASLLCEAEEWEPAKALCEKAIKIHSRSKGFETSEVGNDRKVLAQVFEGLNLHEQALEQHRIVKQIFSGDPGIVHQTNMRIADSLLAMESFSQAIATLESSLDSAPGFARGSVYLKLAKVFKERKNLDESHKCLAACMNFYKENFQGGDLRVMADDVREVAGMFGELGDPVAAGRALRIAIASYDCVPGGEMLVVDSKLEMAAHLISQKNPEAALELSNDALELAEKLGRVSTRILTLVAGVHVKLGRFDAAMELLNRGLELPGDPDERPESQSLARASAHRHLVECNRSLQRYDEAIRHQKLVISALQVLGESAEREVLEARRVLEELDEKKVSSQVENV